MTIDRNNIILQGIVGSTAYGLAHEGSDEDRLGIYAATEDLVLGLNGASLDHPDSPQSVDDSLVKHEPDVTLHELGKYVSLALKANPTVLELLFLPSYDIISPAGRMLVDCRKCFLSSKLIKARYGGYVKSQAIRLLRRNDEGKEGFSSDVKARTEKHARHCLRLLTQGKQLLLSGYLILDVSDLREWIFEGGRQAAADPETFNEMVMSMLAQLDAITNSPLPELPDFDHINKLLIKTRKMSWR